MCPLSKRFEDSIGLSNTTELKCTKILLKSLGEQFHTHVVLKEDHNDRQTNEKIAIYHCTAQEDHLFLPESQRLGGEEMLQPSRRFLRYALSALISWTKLEDISVSLKV